MLTVAIVFTGLGAIAGFYVGTKTAFLRLGRVEHRNRMDAVRGKGK